MRRVVVTGFAAISPLGLRAEETFSALLRGESACAPIRAFSADALPIQIACEVPPLFDPGARFGRRDAEHMDRFSQLGLSAALDAANLAGGLSAYEPSRAGVLFGSGMGGVLSLLEAARALHEKGARAVNPFTIPKLLPSLAAGWISIKLGLTGENQAPATACAASAHAIAQAASLIAHGDLDAAVAGGAEAPVCAVGVAAFASMRALSKTGARPFDSARDGFVLGEGAAALVLEERSCALRRGAQIYAELSGWGSTGDAHHLTAPPDDGAGCARAMQLALSRAQVLPGDIDYVNAHATGTPLGDLAESRALLATLGPTPQVSSTKGATGHLLGAAGALEAVISVLALHQQTIPPTVGLSQPDPSCAIRHVLRAEQPARLRFVLSNSSGFGGANASLLFQRPEPA
jgi:3-oxoacyl-[acyl-carrier-protein] synthase II